MNHRTSEGIKVPKSGEDAARRAVPEPTVSRNPACAHFTAGSVEVGHVGLIPDWWTLVGHGDPGEGCGKPLVLGCMNVRRHPERQAYVRVVRHRCMRRGCPDCYVPWAYREGSRLAKRVKASMIFLGHNLALHGMLSPSQAWGVEMVSTSGGYRLLRQMGYEILAMIGVEGGSVAFHPYRRCHDDGSECDDPGCEAPHTWRVGPHFHFIILGWTHENQVAWVNAQFGWVAKVISTLRTEDEILRCAGYILTHSGYRERGINSVTWFGTLHCSKLSDEILGIREEAPKHEPCPLCGEDLVYAELLDRGRPEGEYLLDPALVRMWTVDTTGWPHDETRVDERYYSE